MSGPVEQRAKLLDLADRVEALEGPDREVDAEVALAAGWRNCIPCDFNGIKSRYGGAMHPPTYTASLDSAMSLMPEGCDFIVDNFDGGLVGFRSSAGVYAGGRWIDCNNAATPALALTAACLRARAQAEEV